MIYEKYEYSEWVLILYNYPMAKKTSEDKVVAVSGDKKAALEQALGLIQKQFGAGAVMKLGDKEGLHVETFSSGCFSLDEALGGGYAKGRIVEIYGPESSGKTTLTLHAIAEIQKAGGIAAFIDAEHALDPTYAKKL